MVRGNAYGALRHQHQRFVDGILAGKSQKQAALDAGYSVKSAETKGSALMRNDKVRRALAEMRAPDIADADEIQRFLTAGMRGKHHQLAGDVEPPFEPMVEREVSCPHCTMPVPVSIEPKDRIKAAEILAKTRGMFAIKLEHSGSVAVEARVGPDTSRWPVELAEEYRTKLEAWAAEEAALVEHAKAALAEEG